MTATAVEALPDQALFEGQVHALVAQTFENERPLRGLAGLLDWRLRGQLSDCIRHGIITGAEGEMAYLPVQHHGQCLHLFFLGGGHNPYPGQRKPPGKDMLRTLEKNLLKLQFKATVGFSSKDFGKINREFFEKEWKGPPTCLLP